MTPESAGPRGRLLIKLGLGIAALVGIGAGLAGVNVLTADSTWAAARTGPGVVRTDAVRTVASDGTHSFGVQPAGPKKPDPRPNFTYQNVKAGQELHDHVAFVNVGDTPVTLTVYAADAYNTSAGAFDLLPEQSASHDLGRWVSMRRKKVVVPARSAVITPVVIKVPGNAEPGDHSGGIVASLKSVTKDSKDNTVTLDQRVGTRMYLRVAGKLTPKISVVDQSARYLSPGNPFGRGDANVTYTIRNIGNVRLVGTKTIRVSDLLGSSTRAIKVPDMPELLPGGSFSFTTRVHKVLPAMMLTAHVTVDPRSVAGNVDPALEQTGTSARFWAIYWPILALLALGAGTGLYRGWLYRYAVRLIRPAGPAHGALTMMVGVVAAGMLILIGSPAQAAGGSGGLTFIPAKGMDISPLYVVTSGPCPAAATNLIGRLYGKGFPADGTVVIPNTASAVEHDAAFGVPLQDTLEAYASEAGVTLRGKYRITVQCVNELATKVFAEFSGYASFATPTHFTAPAPKNAPAEGVPDGFLAQVFPEYRAGADPPASASARASAVVPSTSAGPSTQPTPSPAAVNQKPIASSGTSMKPFLIVILGAVFLGGAGYLATDFRRRRPESGRADSSSAVEWPDDEEDDAGPPRSTEAEPAETDRVDGIPVGDEPAEDEPAENVSAGDVSVAAAPARITESH